ncbi:guanylate-binding protein 1-like isoform X2 [Tympanuchus pallidicinctus]|uniref:guanylate-binding protein 1-like isoform X2 n=1 Tax=Tympanuchus pallidicinctus TaxID=109042 RepID=UPI002286FB1C|nr:guanylate-binding protein 1-like isoform X2 [Tympanuchus pallidicinctus]
MDAAVLPMPAPLCLVNNKNGELSLDPTALAVLQEVAQPLVVVAIAGPYRTGKSFLMNRLAQKRTGFPLGPTVQAETKGIWMWCLPHPQRPGVMLVLLDTEGLGDPTKGDSQNDAWIFTLALLLSSTLVYNSIGTIDQKALEYLELVTQLSELIQVRDRDKDGNNGAEREDEAEDHEFMRFFPSFVWVVRDFTLELRVDERPISEDEYLKQALELKHGYGRKVQQYNATRQCLHNYFPTRKCFVLPSPLGTEEHGRMEELPEAALAPRFLQQAAKFCDYVLSSSRLKTLPDGRALTGRGVPVPFPTALSTLLSSYVEAINSGRLPCLQGAAAAMIANENAAAVAAALEAYAGGMRGLSLPTEPARLSAAHGEHLHEALVIFQQRSFRDRDQEHQRRLMEQISTEYSRLQEENNAASRQLCKALLAELAGALDTSLSRGAYAQPGGYRAYEAERQRLLEAYRQAKGKGPKAEEVLDEFLAERRAEAEAVLKADKALSEAEKQLEDQKQQTQLLEQQQKATAERERQLEALLADERSSYEQNLRALEAKMQAEAESAQRELDRALEAKLREHSELLQHGFSERAALIEREMEALRLEINSNKKHELAASIFNATGNAFKFALELIQSKSRSTAV